LALQLFTSFGLLNDPLSFFPTFSFFLPMTHFSCLDRRIEIPTFLS
jgi:hypothetical protein